MTTKTKILKDIRSFCLHCTGGSTLAVKECVVPECQMYPYRMGVDPNPSRSTSNLNKPSLQRVDS